MLGVVEDGREVLRAEASADSWAPTATTLRRPAVRRESLVPNRYGIDFIAVSTIPAAHQYVPFPLTDLVHRASRPRVVYRLNIVDQILIRIGILI